MSNGNETFLSRPEEKYEWEPGFAPDLIHRHNLETAQKVKQWGALRPLVGFFRCPWPISRAHYERFRKKAIDKWVAQMEKEGWRLMSHVRIYTHKRRRTARPVGDWYSLPDLGEVEIPVAAWFKKNDMKLERIEVPVAEEGEE